MVLATLAAQVTPAGISAPSFADILGSLQDSARTIFGSDIYIAPDSQDGQFLALVAAMMHDGNQADVATFNSFSPSFAQGAGLSSVVKINGIRRLSPSYSTAVGDIAGVVGTVIEKGIVADQSGNLWNLPASVTIPGSGSITVTVTAQKAGAIVAPAGSISKINTPTLGWQSFVSTADAAQGDPVESDAVLRKRQTVSTGLPAQTPLGALFGALANLAGVGRLAVYENTGSTTDGNGIPGHSISVVIEGGDAAEIAKTIGLKKTPGAGTYGSTSQSYTDPITGITKTISFYVLAKSTIKVHVTGTALTGYNTSIATEIKNAVAAYINGLGIGQTVQFSRMYPPSYLNGAPHGATYEITALTTALGAGSPGTADIAITFNHAAACDPATDVTVTIT